MSKIFLDTNVIVAILMQADPCLILPELLQESQGLDQQPFVQ